MKLIFYTKYQPNPLSNAVKLFLKIATFTFIYVKALLLGNEWTLRLTNLISWELSNSWPSGNHNQIVIKQNGYKIQHRHRHRHRFESFGPSNHRSQAGFSGPRVLAKTKPNWIRSWIWRQEMNQQMLSNEHTLEEEGLISFPHCPTTWKFQIQCYKTNITKQNLKKFGLFMEHNKEWNS